MATLKETDLYAPVRDYLMAQGFEVKGEVGAADVMALKDGEAPVIVELKTGFSLQLLVQAVARQVVTERVYVAVPRWQGRAAWKRFKGHVGLCRRLAIGVLTVSSDGDVACHCDPSPFRPRKSKLRQGAMLKEFTRREGDPNTGGMVRKGLVTAYRQEALRCAAFLSEQGPSKGAIVARATNVERATTMMRDNHYGWFEKVEKGIYGLSETGMQMVKGNG